MKTALIVLVVSLGLLALVSAAPKGGKKGGDKEDKPELDEVQKGLRKLLKKVGACTLKTLADGDASPSAVTEVFAALEEFEPIMSEVCMVKEEEPEDEVVPGGDEGGDAPAVGDSRKRRQAVEETDQDTLDRLFEAIKGCELLKSAEDLALLADVDTLNATISQLVSALEAFELDTDNLCEEMEEKEKDGNKKNKDGDKKGKKDKKDKKGKKDKKDKNGKNDKNNNKNKNNKNNKNKNNNNNKNKNKKNNKN